jgi:hypothetical protein
MQTRSILLIVILAAVFAGVRAHAQAKPDFSGRWVQVAPAGESQGGGSEQVITQDATTVTTEHPSEGGGHRQTYKLDGESRSALGEIEIVSKTSWDGPKLVITSTATYPGNRRRESKRVWSLEADGTMTSEFTARNPDGTTTELKSVYRKR